MKRRGSRNEDFGRWKVIKKYIFSLLLTVIIVISSSLCFSETKLSGANEFITENQQLFAKRYVEIINSKNRNFYEKKIIHPFCRDELKKYPEFLNYIFKNRFRNTIPEEHTISIKDINDNEPISFENQFIYPLRPSHILMISYQLTETKGSSIIIQVIKENDKYFEVLAYPNQETAEKMKSKREERDSPFEANERIK